MAFPPYIKIRIYPSKPERAFLSGMAAPVIAFFIGSHTIGEHAVRGSKIP
jgi:hypothetical protein